MFLRVLEYYDGMIAWNFKETAQLALINTEPGILLLTSNRVGTFDEAFKSRIQLALHYDDLTSQQREQIWKNFLARLEHLQEDTNADDIRNHIGELSKYKMNGRQIRNAITTARQLANHKKAKMEFSHLTHVIKVSMKFEKYLEEVNDGVTDNEFMREDGVR